MKNHLQFIKEACHLANPSILELKFGCRVLDGYEVKNILLRETKNGFTFLNTVMQEVHEHKRKDILQEKILGRPIQLADVLYTIRMKLIPGAAGHSNLIHSMIETDVLKYFDLLKDLDGQSEECIEFIYNLLKS